ncbi:MAG: FAD-dependent oxidoreductase [Sodalis sp. (in: enterobacteria)]|uniref:FAD-dependent oxidoreductase n=1 Tax=Sodalis sp. (in: enterobacteria) TaxID=1898979 RepID=UPI003F2A0BEC
MDIIIIGAGVIGASLAFEAINLGASVTVLDAGERVSGTSGTSSRLGQRLRQTPAGLSTIE